MTIPLQVINVIDALVSLVNKLKHPEFDNDPVHKCVMDAAQLNKNYLQLEHQRLVQESQAKVAPQETK